MTNYVLGFAFNGLKDNVLLIEKKKPRWQAGYLNGIGGKIEEGENGPEAMVREFNEETGIHSTEEDWKAFAIMQGTDWKVYCYKSFGLPIRNWEQFTDEMPFVATVKDLHEENVISNVPWLVQMALDGHPSFIATITYQ